MRIDKGTELTIARQPLAVRESHLKKFLKMFPGLSLLPPGVVGVAGVGVGVIGAGLGVGEGETGVTFTFAGLKCINIPYP